MQMCNYSEVALQTTSPVNMIQEQNNQMRTVAAQYGVVVAQLQHSAGHKGRALAGEAYYRYALYCGCSAVVHWYDTNAAGVPQAPYTSGTVLVLVL